MNTYEIFQKRLLTIVSLVSLIIITSLTSFNLRADHITCAQVEHGDISGFVTPTTGCELGEDGMFGYTDWMFDDRYSAGGGQSGTFSFADAITTQIMLVFKGPNANSGTQPDEFVGYILELGSTDYDWTTMFAKYNQNKQQWNPQGVSHISLYYRDGDVTPTCTNCEPVPEPAPLIIIATSLIAMLIRRRFK